MINRWDIESRDGGEIEAECAAQGIPVIGRIPFDPAVIEAVRAGRPVTGTDSPASRALAGCWETLRRESRFLRGGRPDGHLLRRPAARTRIPSGTIVMMMNVLMQRV